MLVHSNYWQACTFGTPKRSNPNCQCCCDGKSRQTCHSTEQWPFCVSSGQREDADGKLADLIAGNPVNFQLLATLIEHGDHELIWGPKNLSHFSTFCCPLEGMIYFQTTAVWGNSCFFEWGTAWNDLFPFSAEQVIKVLAKILPWSKSKKNNFFIQSSIVIDFYVTETMTRFCQFFTTYLFIFQTVHCNFKHFPLWSYQIMHCAS